MCAGGHLQGTQRGPLRIFEFLELFASIARSRSRSPNDIVSANSCREPPPTQPCHGPLLLALTSALLPIFTNTLVTKYAAQTLSRQARCRDDCRIIDRALPLGNPICPLSRLSFRLSSLACRLSMCSSSSCPCASFLVLKPDQAS